MYKQLYFDKAPELVKMDNTGKQYIDIECHYSRKDCYGIGRLYDNNTVLLTEGIYMTNADQVQIVCLGKDTG